MAALGKSLERRLKALEQRNADPTALPVTFTRVVGAKDGKASGHERIVSAMIGGMGSIKREDTETAGGFCRRVFAMKVANKAPEEMTDEELQICLAAGSAEMVLELAETGKISHEILESAVGYLIGRANA